MKRKRSPTTDDRRLATVPLIHKSAVIYISGPMRGCIKYNFPKFFAVEKFLVETYGCKVLNPARITDGHIRMWHKGIKGQKKIRAYAKHDLDLIFNASAMFMLDEWQTSLGATAEVSLARWLNLDIYHEQELIP